MRVSNDLTWNFKRNTSTKYNQGHGPLVNPLSKYLQLKHLTFDQHSKYDALRTAWYLIQHTTLFMAIISVQGGQI